MSSQEKSQKRKKPKSRKLQPRKPNPLLDERDAEAQTLEDLLAKVGVGVKGWDILIVGDGSGCSNTSAAGWGSVMIERDTMSRTVWAGFATRGTVNFAELLAYLQPLEFLADQELKRREAGGLTRAYRVHIITDSDYCRLSGNNLGAKKKRNAGYWGVFNVFLRHGFVLTWHHLNRELCELNVFCDKLSKLARKTGMEYNPVSRLTEASNATVYAVNPSEFTGRRKKT